MQNLFIKNVFTKKFMYTQQCNNFPKLITFWNYFRKIIKITELLKKKGKF